MSHPPGNSGPYCNFNYVMLPVFPQTHPGGKHVTPCSHACPGEEENQPRESPTTTWGPLMGQGALLAP